MEPQEQVQYLMNNIRLLLQQVGDSGYCKGCQKPITWVKHKNGVKAPYTSTGLNHFADCPNRKDFKKQTP